MPSSRIRDISFLVALSLSCSHLVIPDLPYFAYGSNMSVRRLRQRVPAARALAAATLFGHELRFHKRGRDGSGKCDAWLSDKDDSRVCGVLFDIPRAGKADLDRIEGLGTGYGEKTVQVRRVDGHWAAASTYYAIDIDEHLHPFCWYRHHVLAGAREFHLPADYISAIEAIDVVVDTDTVRRAREYAVHGAISGTAGATTAANPASSGRYIPPPGKRA